MQQQASLSVQRRPMSVIATCFLVGVEALFLLIGPIMLYGGLLGGYDSTINIIGMIGVGSSVLLFVCGAALWQLKTWGVYGLFAVEIFVILTNITGYTLWDQLTALALFFACVGLLFMLLVSARSMRGQTP